MTVGLLKPLLNLIPASASVTTRLAARTILAAFPPAPVNAPALDATELVTYEFSSAKLSPTTLTLPATLIEVLLTTALTSAGASIKRSELTPINVSTSVPNRFSERTPNRLNATVTPAPVSPVSTEASSDASMPLRFSASTSRLPPPMIVLESMSTTALLSTIFVAMTPLMASDVPSPWLLPPLLVTNDDVLAMMSACSSAAIVMWPSALMSVRSMVVVTSLRTSLRMSTKPAATESESETLPMLGKKSSAENVSRVHRSGSA